MDYLSTTNQNNISPEEEIKTAPEQSSTKLPFTISSVIKEEEFSTEVKDEVEEPITREEEKLFYDEKLRSSLD